MLGITNYGKELVPISQLKQLKFRVTGMSCSACSSHIERAVGKMQAVTEVQVNLLANTMQVTFDAEQTDPQEIIRVVEQEGYGAAVYVPEREHGAADVTAADIRSLKRRLIWSFIFLIPLMYIAMHHMTGLPLPDFLLGDENALYFISVQLVLTLPVIIMNRKYYINGFKALFKRAPNMDTLIAIGSSAALLYGIYVLIRVAVSVQNQSFAEAGAYAEKLYFESAATILALITLGKFLEAKSKGRTKDAITKLIRLSPKTAVVVRNGTETEIPAEQLIPGDIVVIRPGSSIPADGTIIEGHSAIDESAITGESLPVEKAEGDYVIAATINKSGYFQFRAEKVGSDTTLSKIIQLVEDASATKAPIAKLADKVAGIFVPIVMGIAAVAFLIWLMAGSTFEFAVSIGISVLVISCPCSLGLATPLAIMVGTGKGAENGILIKSAESLETAHSINTVIMDKTGTITAGRPAVTAIVPAAGIEAAQLLRIAAALEVPSEHPFAEAIVSAYTSPEKLPAAENFTAVHGKGVTGRIQGTVYFAGNAGYMQEAAGIEAAALQSTEAPQAGATPLYFAESGRLMGTIFVADPIKESSAAAVSELKQMGIRVVMLTGDNKKTAEEIARKAGIESVIAEVLPQDKERIVSESQKAGQVTAMIGDGINDAPALARADVSIAIGAGTDIAIESADIILMKSDLYDAVTAVKLSKAVMRNIRQNLFWAFFYNTVGIPIAAGALYPYLHITLNPMIAAAAMSMSSICVVLNALRLRRFSASRRKKS